MSIRWDTRNKRWRFEFDRVIAGRRRRTSRLLPKGWSQAQADAFDRKEGARIYAVATGVDPQGALIETAIAHYVHDKTQLKSYQSLKENLAAISWACEGRTFAELPEVCHLVAAHRERAQRDGQKRSRNAEQPLSDATVHQRLALLKAACRWGWKKHAMCEADPTARMQIPEVRNERHLYATLEQVKALAAAADRDDVRALILAAFYTGMRFGELRRVEVADGALHLADTKNGQRRSVPVHPQLRRQLKHLPLTAPRSTLERGWQRARAAAGLEQLHLHDLRHTAASEMINAGVDLYTVGAVLGHKDARSTQRYAHLRHETLAEAVGKIGRIPPHTRRGAAKKKAA